MHTLKVLKVISFIFLVSSRGGLITDYKGLLKHPDFKKAIGAASAAEGWLPCFLMRMQAKPDSAYFLSLDLKVLLRLFDIYFRVLCFLRHVISQGLELFFAGGFE